MKYSDITQTNSGRSRALAVDDFQCPFSLGIGAKVTTGTPTFNIEYSFDDPSADGYTVAGATWYVASGFGGATASTGGVLSTPCKAICINITSGSGTVVASSVQAGPV